MHSLFAGFNGGSRALSAVSESGLFLTGDGEKIFLLRERRGGIYEITGMESVKIISGWGERKEEEEEKLL